MVVEEAANRIRPDAFLGQLARDARNEADGVQARVYIECDHAGGEGVAKAVRVGGGPTRDDGQALGFLEGHSRVERGREGADAGHFVRHGDVDKVGRMEACGQAGQERCQVTLAWSCRRRHGLRDRCVEYWAVYGPQRGEQRSPLHRLLMCGPK